MLEDSCLSQFQPSSAHPTKQEWISRRESSAVIAQWEADLDVDESVLSYDCLRLGLTGEAQRKYIESVLNISNVTTQIHEIWNILGHGWDYDAESLPSEEEYPISNGHIMSVLAPPKR
ncbi:hypothetical protein N7509_002916 [Penicillium cosmopolitanum]|uniref:Uncharacterized protein n=1 Tax=Penicillium cosmopolitanum TaxID=1131564 RepID=A0A9X0BDS4_9EURO|nr:uncharacterized protein N7509_002916 [Penicillium cosmopolitanum]KAJ5409033.1 hypothetical protein N7509_002916 [Penicillium cosmopolitanum]